MDPITIAAKELKRRNEQLQEELNDAEALLRRWLTADAAKWKGHTSFMESLALETDAHLTGKPGPYCECGVEISRADD